MNLSLRKDKNDHRWDGRRTKGFSAGGMTKTVSSKITISKIKQ